VEPASPQLQSHQVRPSGRASRTDQRPGPLDGRADRPVALDGEARGVRRSAGERDALAVDHLQATQRETAPLADFDALAAGHERPGLRAVVNRQQALAGGRLRPVGLGLQTIIGRLRASVGQEAQHGPLDAAVGPARKQFGLQRRGPALRVEQAQVLNAGQPAAAKGHTDRGRPARPWMRGRLDDFERDVVGHGGRRSRRGRPEAKHVGNDRTPGVPAHDAGLVGLRRVQTCQSCAMVSAPIRAGLGLLPKVVRAKFHMPAFHKAAGGPAEVDLAGRFRPGRQMLALGLGQHNGHGGQQELVHAAGGLADARKAQPVTDS